MNPLPVRSIEALAPDTDRLCDLSKRHPSERLAATAVTTRCGVGNRTEELRRVLAPLIASAKRPVVLDLEAREKEDEGVAVVASASKP